MINSGFLLAQIISFATLCARLTIPLVGILLVVHGKSSLVAVDVAGWSMNIELQPQAVTAVCKGR